MDYTEAKECLINTLGEYRNKYTLRQPLAIRVGHDSRADGYVAYSLEANCVAWGKERNVAISEIKNALMASYFDSFRIDKDCRDILDRERIRLLQWLIQEVPDQRVEN